MTVGFAEVDSVEKLAELDHEEILEGYREGRTSTTPPSGRSRSYIHGWLNAQVDAGRMLPSEAQRKLAKDFLE